MVTWLTNTFNTYTSGFQIPFLGGWSQGNSWLNGSSMASGSLFCWDFLKTPSYSPMITNSIFPTMATPSLGYNWSNPFSFNFSNPFAFRYPTPQLSLPSFSDFLNLTYTPSSSTSSPWSSMGLNLSTSTSNNSFLKSNAVSSSGLTCSTQNINSKNAPYNGYDKSPHSAVNSNVNNYTKYGNNKHIAQLEPEFQLKVMKIIDYAKQHGYDIKITSSFRTRSHQDRLRQKYKNQKGRAAKVSPHMFGKAIDYQVLKNGRKSSAGYDLIGKYAESLGVRWGGRFKTCVERWHIDYNWA